MKAGILSYLFMMLSSYAFSQAWDVTGGSMNNQVYSLTTFNSALYAAGAFTQAGGSFPAERIARWNGISWSALGQGLHSSTSSSGIHAMAVYNNELYVAGEIDSAGGQPADRIAKWNGSAWSAVGSGATYIGTPHSLCVFQNKLYVGGGNGGINVWDGSAWSDIVTVGDVLSMIVFNNELYAGGTITVVDGVSVSKLARFNGSSWSDVSGGLEQLIGSVNVAKVKSMMVYNTALIVGGVFQSAGSVNAKNIVKWNGSSWSDINGGLDADVNAMATCGNVLYVVGNFTKAGSSQISCNKAVSLTGTSWAAIGSLNAGVSMAIWNNKLYACGSMAVYQWNGGICGSIGMEDAAWANGFNIFPNPAVDEVSIQLPYEGKFKLSLTAMDGRGIKDFEAEISSSYKMDVSGLRNGLYILTLSDGEFQVRKKMQVSR